jgi:hypothetical protein
VIHCCICLNQKGTLIAASTVVKGYAVCAEHVDLVSRPDFDIHRIKAASRGV